MKNEKETLMALSICVIKNLADNTRRVVVRTGDRNWKSAKELQENLDRHPEEGRSPKLVESFLVRDDSSDEVMLKELLDAVYNGTREFFYEQGYRTGSDFEE